MADVGRLAVVMTARDGGMVRDAKAIATRAGTAARQGFAAVSGGQLGGILGALGFGGMGGSFGGRLGTAVGEVAGPWAAIAAGIVSFGHVAVAQIRQVIDEVSKLVDQSSQLGVTFNALVGLQHAGSMVGMELGEVSRTLEILQRNVGQAALGTGEAADALRRLGIDARYLSSLNADRQFEQIAEALSQVENASERAALAQRIFGRSGRGALRIIAQGSGFLRRMQQDAHSLGQTLDPGLAEDIDTLGDELGRLQAGSSGVWRQMTAAIAPLATQITQELIPSLQDTVSVIRAIGAAWRETETARNVAQVGIDNFRLGWQALLAQIPGNQALQMIQGFSNGVNEVAGRIKRIRDEMNAQGTQSISSQAEHLMSLMSRLQSQRPRDAASVQAGTAQAVELTSRFSAAGRQSQQTDEQILDAARQALQVEADQLAEQTRTRELLEAAIRAGMLGTTPSGTAI